MQQKGEPKRKKNLQKLLKEAQKKQQRMAELKEQGGGKIPQYAWDASMARAMGDKVLDDPKLIKKSMTTKVKQDFDITINGLIKASKLIK